MSQHSALASLTAQYTDSEDEEEVEGGEPKFSTVQIIKKVNTGNSPRTDSQPLTLSGESQKLVETTKPIISNPSTKGGLVSYQDDFIDDDLDYVHPPEPSSDGVEEGESDTRTEVDKTAQADIPLKNGDTSSSIEVVDLESGEPPAKKSLIPPEPPGKCTPELQEKFAKMLEKKVKGGLDMNLAIQRNKNFRNPSIYEKLIKYCDIDELGSNYPSNVFDPHEWHESSYYDELAKAQKELMERRERERKERTKVEFVSGIVKKPAPYEPEPKRKSKWDQRGGVMGVMPPLLLPTITYSQPNVVLPPFTNTASGTKSTVINAFGNINRKQK